MEKRLKIPLGKDVRNEILGFLLPCKVGDIWSGGTWSGSDVSQMMVVRCSPDKVWLKQIWWDQANSPWTKPIWIDHPNPTRHKPGKSTRRKINFEDDEYNYRGYNYGGMSVTIGVSIYRPGLRWRR